MQTLARQLALPAVFLLAAPFPIAYGDEDLDSRLDRLVEHLDDRREQLHVPGLAIAIVKDGEVILSRGLGLADVESERPVTPDTVFAVGSSTKTFTSALVAIGVDRGELDLDRPVSDALPGFRLPPAEDADEASLRDLLCHRTGLTRMPLLWASGRGAVEDMLDAVPHAEYAQPFREGWLYNNVTYSMAGYAAAHAAGTTWDELVHDRILEPIGMHNSRTDLGALTDNPAAALGYFWDAEAGAYEHLPPRDLRLIAPAGAINSSVSDMTRWVALLLNEGSTAEGRTIVTPAALGECWHPQVTMPDGRSYGLGWMIAEHNGRKYYEHGGNIDGFASTLAVMPDEGIGVTALMNVSASSLQGEVITMAFDAVLGEDGEPETAEAKPDEGAERFVGSYAFDALGGDMVVELGDDGTLVCHIPNQGSTPLASPDDEGKRAFSVNPAVKVRFKENDAGEIIAMEFFQAGSHLELPKRDADGNIITPGLPFDEAQLRALTGRYHFPPLGQDCTVLYQDGGLAMDVPTQMTYALAWDDANDRWRFRDHPVITLVFNQEDGVPPGSITFTQGPNTYEMPRVGDAPGGELPTLAELAQLRATHTGSAELGDDTTMRIEAKIRVTHQGIRGKGTMLVRGPRTRAEVTDLSPFAFSRTVVTPEIAWSDSAFTPEPEHEEPGSAAYDLALHAHPWSPLLPLDLFSEDVRISGIQAAGDTPGAIAVIITPEHAREIRHLLDPETGRTIEMRSWISTPTFGDVPITATYSRWRKVDGVWYPHRWVIDNPHTGETEFEVSEIAFGVALPEGAFEIGEIAEPAGAGGG